MSAHNKMDDSVSLFVPHSSQTTEGNKTGSWRFLRPRYDEKTAPCSAACPAGEDVGRIEMLTARGLLREAFEKILVENPFPGVCGRLCFHPCETKCNRREFDEGIAIHIIERFLAERGAIDAVKPPRDRSAPKNRKIAVLGAGLAGLSAAHFLTRLGYGCDIFESSAEPGGALRYGAQARRLPAEVLRAEIERVCGQGFGLFCGKPLSKGFVEEIKSEYDGVFLDCGPPEGEKGGFRRANLIIVEGPPVIVHGGERVSKIKSVAHEVASGKEAAIALDIIFMKGFDRVAEGVEACRVGNGPFLSMEIYMQGPRRARNRHIVTYGEINTDHFQISPGPVASDPMKEAGRCFNCGLCNECDNCRLYCPDMAVVCESGPGGRRIDYDYCKGCGICVVECPRNAMSLEKE